MEDFLCPHCYKRYETLGLLASHMENDDKIHPAWVTQWVMTFQRDGEPPVPFAPQAIQVSEKSEAAADLGLRSKRFRVWFVLDNNCLQKREIPSDESFRGFCSQLSSLYDMKGWNFDIDQFEYILVEKRFHRMEDVQPFFDAGSYHQMVKKLMGVRSHWRHAIVRRRTVSKRSPSLHVMVPLTYFDRRNPLH